MKRLVTLTVAAIGVLTGGLALYLFWAGTLLNKIAANLEDSADLVRSIDGHAKSIGPGVERVNQAGSVVAGALPLLYGMAEQIVRDSGTPEPEQAGPTRPASGTRRSPLHGGVGYGPPS